MQYAPFHKAQVTLYIYLSICLLLSIIFKAVLTLYQTTYFGHFQSELADDNFKFDENGRKFSKTLENTVEKLEIARYEQFLIFPQ